MPFIGNTVFVALMMTNFGFEENLIQKGRFLGF